MAQLNTSISFTDINGKSKRLPKGSTITVTMVGALNATDSQGRRCADLQEAYVGSYMDHSFDVEAFEFSTLQ